MLLEWKAMFGSYLQEKKDKKRFQKKKNYAEGKVALFIVISENQVIQQILINLSQMHSRNGYNKNTKIDGILDDYKAKQS